MEWVIEYLEDDGIVYGKTSGVIDAKSLWKYNREMIATARKHGSHKFLSDLLDMTGHFTILQIDDIPQQTVELGIRPEDKNAVMPNPELEKQKGFAFFKDLAKICEIQFESFSDKDKAIAWLNE
jgi:hypothetical protein